MKLIGLIELIWFIGFIWLDKAIVKDREDRGLGGIELKKRQKAPW
jgi:hypothetical protein